MNYFELAKEILAKPEKCKFCSGQGISADIDVQFICPVCKGNGLIEKRGE